MSFFANIIADSRRRIKPIHRYDSLPGALPVELNSDKAFVSETAEQTEPVKNKITGNDDVSNQGTKTTKVAAVLQPQTATETADATTPGITPTKTHVFPDTKQSVSIAHRLTSPVVPTVQLKTTQGDQSNRMPSKSSSKTSGEANVAHGAKPDVAQLTTIKIDPIQEQPVAKSLISPEAPLSKPYTCKQDEPTQVQFDIAKSELLTESIIDLVEIHPEDAGSRVAINTQSQQFDDQHVEASTVLAEINTESTARAIQPVTPVNSEHEDALIKNQPRVQIGQVNVVIEQSTPPSRRASSIAASDDYASRNFLKSL